MEKTFLHDLSTKACCCGAGATTLQTKKAKDLAQKNSTIKNKGTIGNKKKCTTKNTERQRNLKSIEEYKCALQ